MRIISKFRDIYDGMARYGVDENLVYNRATVKEVVEVPALRNSRSLWKEVPGLDRTCSIIRIGEHIIPLVITSEIKQESISAVVNYYYEVNELPEKIHHGLYGFSRPATRFLSEPKTIISVLNSVPQTTPIDVVTGVFFTQDKYMCHVHRDVRLMDYQIHRVCDAYTIHTHVSSYLANRSNPEKPIVEIEDKFKIQQHGFDNKVSFRHRKA